jgi:hypothetical protein
MAEMNLLKSTFTGSLGRVTGASWKGKPVVKARIFSKAPPSNAQTQSVRAFEALNRISAVIAKQGFSYMGLSQKTLLPHNAVAKLLKPIIKNHVFDIKNAVEVMPKDGDQVILGFTHNKTTEQATLKIGLGSSFVPVTGTKTFINVFNQYGYSFFSDFIDTSDYSKSFFMPYSPENQYNAMIFMSEPAYKGVFLHGLDFKQGAGMQYSLDEQLTGDLWLDGRPIYQRSFTGTVNLVASSNVVVTLSGPFDNIISWSGVIQRSTTTNFLIPSRTVDNTESANHTVCDISHIISSGNIIITIRPSASIDNAQYYFTLKYTKL